MQPLGGRDIDSLGKKWQRLNRSVGTSRLERQKGKGERRKEKGERREKKANERLDKLRPSLSRIYTFHSTNVLRYQELRTVLIKYISLQKSTITSK